MCAHETSRTLASFLNRRVGLARSVARGLGDLFSPGFLVEDSNGDGLADFVSAGIVLGEAPSPAAIAAASDVAARLEFQRVVETITATRFDVPMSETVFTPLGKASSSFLWEDRSGVVLLTNSENGLRPA